MLREGLHALQPQAHRASSEGVVKRSQAEKQEQRDGSIVCQRFADLRARICQYKALQLSTGLCSWCIPGWELPSP